MHIANSKTSTIKDRHGLHNKAHGFTLIEMAIVVLLLGLAIASLSPLYKVHLKNKTIEQTEINVESIASAVGNFRSLYGRYPCPASLTLTRDSVDYGRENCDDAGAIPADRELFDTAIGTCTNGICVEQAITGRDVTYTDPSTKDPVTKEYAAAVTQRPRVLVGFIPFRQLNIEEDDAYDGYGNRIMYVVTEHLAYSETFQPDGGGIEILNDNGVTTLDTAGSAHFMTFSYGENGKGGYTQAGVRTDCPSAASIEIQNTTCNIGAASDAVFINAQTNKKSDTISEFDDVMNYFTQSSIPLWQLSETELNQKRGDIHDKASGKLGILTSGADLEEENQIAGTIRAQDDTLTGGVTEGKIIINSVCDENGINCFEPKIFSGVIDDGTGGMKCPDNDLDGTGKFMVGIRNGTPVCEDEVIVRCPVNQFMQGIDANGKPICVGAPQACATEQRIICGQNKSIPAGADGTTYGLTGGANRVETYRCNGTSWSANPTSTSGSCTCNASTTVNNNTSCGSGYTGTYTSTTTTVCPSGVTTTTGDRSSCVCELSSHLHNYACPSGLSGAGETIRHRHLCNPARWITENVSYDCSCVEKTETRNGTCPTNQVGEIRQEWKYECPEQKWEFVREISNTCRCVSRTEVREKSCASGLQGSIKEEWKYDCNTNQWSFVKELSDTCRTCQWEANGSGVAERNTKAGGAVGSTCSCGTTENSCHQKLGRNNYRNYWGSCQCK